MLSKSKFYCIFGNALKFFYVQFQGNHGLTTYKYSKVRYKVQKDLVKNDFLKTSFYDNLIAYSDLKLNSMT